MVFYYVEMYMMQYLEVSLHPTKKDTITMSQTSPLLGDSPAMNMKEHKTRPLSTCQTPTSFTSTSSAKIFRHHIMKYLGLPPKMITF
jgi:hypothetical protein